MTHLRLAIIARIVEIGITQAALARSAGVSRPDLHRWLAGRKPTVTVETLGRICAALGLAVQLVQKTNPRGDSQ